MNAGLPFYLAPGEAQVKDEANVFYYGIGIEFVGMFGGAGDSFFGGLYSSIQHKREKKFLDRRLSHMYLTSYRLVFIHSHLSLLNKETLKNDILSEIPLDAIQGMSPGMKISSPSIEMPIRIQEGRMDNIAISFFGRVKAPFTSQERDAWIRLIEDTRSKYILSKNARSHEHLREDPLELLKLRFAKGEISKAEYEEMRAVLER